MKKTSIQISYSSERLSAIKHYMKGKEGGLDKEMEDALQKLYEKIVPKDVRGFLEAKESTEEKKPARTPKPKGNSSANGASGQTPTSAASPTPSTPASGAAQPPAAPATPSPTGTTPARTPAATPTTPSSSAPSNSPFSGLRSSFGSGQSQ